jgi:hypothetical protein
MDRPPDLRIDVWFTTIREDDFESYTQTRVRDDPEVVRALRDSGTQAHVAARVLELLDEFDEAVAKAEGGA